MFNLDCVNIRKQISSISYHIENLRNISNRLNEINYFSNQVFIQTLNKKLLFDDIILFEKCYNKNHNDFNNKKREQIIYAIVNGMIPIHWFRDDRWRCVKRRLENFIRKVSNGLEYELELKASRSCHFDFIMKLSNNTIKKLEFKFNLSDITETPQFLSLSTNNIFVNLGQKSYGEYFYDNYINNLEILYNIKAPSKDEYLKNLYQINHNKHIFFLTLKEDISVIKKEQKKNIVDSSIHYFLRDNAYHLDIKRLNDKLKKSQDGKIFMLYSHKKNKFFKDRIKNSELIATKILKLKTNSKKLYNTIVLQTKCKTTNIHMLLRWRNHAGVLNPAWQIKLVRVKNL